MIVNVFKFFINNFFTNLIHGKTYFSFNIFRGKWTNLGNHVNNGKNIGKKSVQRLETLLQGDQKILSEVITFILKSILDTKVFKDCPGHRLQRAVSRANFRGNSRPGHLEPEEGSETGEFSSWGRILAEELAGGAP